MGQVYGTGYPAQLAGAVIAPEWRWFRAGSKSNDGISACRQSNGPAVGAKDRRIVKLSAESYREHMAQMNISIPEALKSWAEARVAEGSYSSTSDYVRDLVRRDRDYAEKVKALQAAIDEGFASPEVDTSIEDIIARGLARHGLS